MEETTKVICLTEARRRYDAKACQHLNIVVDERHNAVECAKCGEKLNPVWVLARFSREQSQWWQNHLAMKEERKLLEAKQRTKCQHCGKMTRIRV